MSEMSNVDLFKSRLAQLKKILERDARIAENLFYAALQLDKNKELKAGVQSIIEKHKLKVKKGYIALPDDVKDRPAAVKALLKDAFELLLKAFSVDKASLVPRKTPEIKVHALQLFEMQSTLETESHAQAHVFESTMHDLDSIDTSTPLEQTVIFSPPTEDGEHESPPTSTQPVPVNYMPAPPKPPAQPVVVSKLALAEQAAGENAHGDKPAIIVLSPGSSAPQKTIPLPPKTPSREQKPGGGATGSPVEKQAGVAKPGPALPVAINQAPVLVHVPTPATVSSSAPVSTASTSATSIASTTQSQPMSYEYYVCNRCGAETSKSVIKQTGSFLECPSCKFKFSRAEATVIKKAPPASDIPARSISDDGKKQFDIYASKLPGEDESLIRPSALFGNRDKADIEDKPARPSAVAKEKEPVPPVRLLKPVKPTEAPRPKPRPVPSERLVRPSEVLGMKEATRRSEAEKIVQNAADEYENVEEELEPVQPTRSVDAEKIAQTTASEYFEEGVVPALTQQPVSKVSKPAFPPSEATAPAPISSPEAPPGPGDICPRCGASKYSRVQDRNKIISYNPLMYGNKKRCTMCSFEFD